MELLSLISLEADDVPELNFEIKPLYKDKDKDKMRPDNVLVAKKHDYSNG